MSLSPTSSDVMTKYRQLIINPSINQLINESSQSLNPSLNPSLKPINVQHLFNSINLSIYRLNDHISRTLADASVPITRASTPSVNQSTNPSITPTQAIQSLKKSIDQEFWSLLKAEIDRCNQSYTQQEKQCESIIKSVKQSINQYKGQSTDQSNKHPFSFAFHLLAAQIIQSIKKPETINQGLIHPKSHVQSINQSTNQCDMMFDSLVKLCQMIEGLSQYLMINYQLIWRIIAVYNQSTNQSTNQSISQLNTFSPNPFVIASKMAPLIGRGHTLLSYAIEHYLTNNQPIYQSSYQSIKDYLHPSVIDCPSCLTTSTMDNPVLIGCVEGHMMCFGCLARQPTFGDTCSIPHQANNQSNNQSNNRSTKMFTFRISKLVEIVARRGHVMENTSTKQSVSHSTTQSTNQSSNQSTCHSAHPTLNKTLGQAITQLSVPAQPSRAVSQPVHQSLNQSINHYDDFPYPVSDPITVKSEYPSYDIKAEFQPFDEYDNQSLNQSVSHSSNHLVNPFQLKPEPRSTHLLSVPGKHHRPNLTVHTNMDSFNQSLNHSLHHSLSPTSFSSSSPLCSPIDGEQFAQFWRATVNNDSSDYVKKGQGVSCHQCKTNKDPSQLLFCANPIEKGVRRRRCRKKYCEQCLKRAYGLVGCLPSSNKWGNDWHCPSCSGECHCASCIRTHTPVSGYSEQSIKSSPPMFSLNDSAKLPTKHSTNQSANQKKRKLSNPTAFEYTLDSPVSAQSTSQSAKPSKVYSSTQPMSSPFQYMGQSTSQSVNHLISQPNNQSNGQSNNLSNNPSNSQFMTRSLDRNWNYPTSNDQPISRSVSQSINSSQMPHQSLRQSVNQISQQAINQATQHQLLTQFLQQNQQVESGRQSPVLDSISQSNNQPVNQSSTIFNSGNNQTNPFDSFNYQTLYRSQSHYPSGNDSINPTTRNSPQALNMFGGSFVNDDFDQPINQSINQLPYPVTEPSLGLMGSSSPFDGLYNQPISQSMNQPVNQSNSQTKSSHSLMNNQSINQPTNQSKRNNRLPLKVNTDLSNFAVNNLPNLVQSPPIGHSIGQSTSQSTSHFYNSLTSPVPGLSSSFSHSINQFTPLGSPLSSMTQYESSSNQSINQSINPSVHQPFTLCGSPLLVHSLSASNHSSIYPGFTDLDAYNQSNNSTHQSTEFECGLPLMDQDQSSTMKRHETGQLEPWAILHSNAH